MARSTGPDGRGAAAAEGYESRIGRPREGDRAADARQWATKHG